MTFWPSLLILFYAHTSSPASATSSSLLPTCQSEMRRRWQAGAELPVSRGTLQVSEIHKQRPRHSLKHPSPIQGLSKIWRQWNCGTNGCLAAAPSAFARIFAGYCRPACP